MPRGYDGSDARFQSKTAQELGPRQAGLDDVGEWPKWQDGECIFGQSRMSFAQAQNAFDPAIEISD